MRIGAAASVLGRDGRVFLGTILPTRRHPGDPVVEHADRADVDLVRAEPGHVAATELGNPVIAHRTRGVPGRDDPRSGDLECPLDRADVNRPGLGERHLESQGDVRRAAGVELVAVRAVRLEVRPRAAAELGRLVVRIGQVRQSLGLGRPAQQAEPMEDGQLVEGSSAIVARPVQLGRVDSQRRGRLHAEDRRPLLDPRIVAEDAFGPGMDPIVPRPRRALAGLPGDDRSRTSRRIGQGCVGLVVVPDV